jgi:hypothetical protein
MKKDIQKFHLLLLEIKALRSSTRRANWQILYTSLIVTPWGVTVNGANHMTPSGQASPNNTYLNHKSFK